jgi:hypothetical protein
LEEMRNKIKEQKLTIDETRKDRNKKIDMVNAEKKKYNKIKYDYESMQK